MGFLICNKCRQQIADDAHFCGYCGNQIHSEARVLSPLSPPEQKQENGSYQGTPGTRVETLGPPQGAVEPIGLGARIGFFFLSLVLFVIPVGLFSLVFVVPGLGRMGRGTFADLFVEGFGPIARPVLALILLAMSSGIWRAAVGALNEAFKKGSRARHRRLKGSG